jgi:hypothetical protein
MLGGIVLVPFILLVSTPTFPTPQMFETKVFYNSILERKSGNKTATIIIRPEILKQQSQRNILIISYFRMALSAGLEPAT